MAAAVCEPVVAAPVLAGAVLVAEEPDPLAAPLVAAPVLAAPEPLATIGFQSGFDTRIGKHVLEAHWLC